MNNTFTKAQLVKRGWTERLMTRWLPPMPPTPMGEPPIYPAAVILKLEALPPVQIRLEETFRQRKASGQPALMHLTPLDLEEIHSLGNEEELVPNNNIRTMGWSRRMIKGLLRPRAFTLQRLALYSLPEVLQHEANPAFKHILDDLHEARERGEKAYPGKTDPKPDQAAIEKVSEKRRRVTLINRRRTARNDRQQMQRTERTDQQQHNEENIARMMSSRPERGGPLWS